MDPNTIISPPTEREVWLTPDWSTYKPVTVAKPAGATKVSVRETRYADGRVVLEVLDENRQPIKTRVLEQIMDPDQEKRFKDAQATATRGDQEGDIRGSQTGPTREVYRGGKWVVEQNPVYQPPAGSNTKEWRTEGTPDGRGGFDNSRPTMAAYVNGQRTGETRPPTAKEIEDWNLAGQMTRNPGGKTDAQIAAETKAATAAQQANQPKAGPPKKNAQGQWVQDIIDAQGNVTGTRPVPPDAIPKEDPPKPTTGRDEQDVPNRPGWKRVTETDTTANTRRTYYLNPEGREAPLPAEGGLPVEPAGAPPASVVYGQVTESLTKYRDFLNERVRDGSLSAADASKLMETRLAAANATIKEQESVVSTQSGTYGQGITQRGQSLRDTESRRNAASSTYNQVIGAFLPMLKFMPKGGGRAFADVMMAALEYGKTIATDWGGMRESPEIQPGPALQQANQTAMPGGTFLDTGGAQAAAAEQAAAQQQQAATAAAAAVPPSVPGIPENVVIPVPGSTPPVNPMPGQPGADPNAPVGMAPPQTFMGQYNPQPQPQQSAALGTLVSDGWMPNDLVAKAFQEVYGVPMPGSNPQQNVA